MPKSDDLDEVPTLPHSASSVQHSYSKHTKPAPSTQTPFGRRADLLRHELHRYRKFSWIVGIKVVSFIDISLAISAVILGSLTVNFCDGNADTAKIFAIVNTIVSALIALFKGTGLPACLILIDQRARGLYYLLEILRAGCPMWDPHGPAESCTGFPHKEHEIEFNAIQAEYKQLEQDFGETIAQIFTGSSTKPNPLTPKKPSQEESVSKITDPERTTAGKVESGQTAGGEIKGKQRATDEHETPFSSRG